MTRCPSDLELEAFLLGRGPASAASHVGGCARCGARLDEMRRIGDEFRREVFPATVDTVVARGRRRTSRRRWAFAIAPLSAAAAVAAIVLATRAPHDYVGAKGGGFSLTVFVQTADGARAAADGEEVPASAAVRFRVQPARPCRLWVVSVDAAGQVSRLYPAAGDEPAGITSPGPLPGGAILDGRPGPERVFAVCSERPLPYPEVERAARAAAAGGDGALRSARGLGGLPARTAQATLLLEKRP